MKTSGDLVITTKSVWAVCNACRGLAYFKQMTDFVNHLLKIRLVLTLSGDKE
jgi:hypothetical protein